MTTSGMGAVTPTEVKDIVKELNKNLGLPDISKETFTKVLCNDGTTQNVGSNPLGGRVDMPCRNNGGVSKNQPTTTSNTEPAITKTNNFIEKNKTNLIIALVLVGGYFAYKKFKK